MLRGKDTHCIFRESNKGTMCGIYQNERAIGYGIHAKLNDFIYFVIASKNQMYKLYYYKHMLETRTTF